MARLAVNASGASRGVVVLGSTGSIGRSTLDVLAALPERFHVVGLAASQNADALQLQIDQHRPRYASLTGAPGSGLRDVRVLDGPHALADLATLPEADIVVVATSGHAAIVPTMCALQAGKIVALANKETIVSAGALVMPLARSGPGVLRPVDSEHSALWQCLGFEDADLTQVERLVLTASGGPFRGWSAERLRAVRPADALRHPNWEMGSKITIDSATLMNKGLELLEAAWLFDCPLAAVDVVVHPQSIVHSLVEFRDGSLLAQLGSHDMRLPIQLALTYPERLPGPARRLSLLDVARLDFEAPDPDAFPLLRIARQAGELGGLYPTVLSAADEVAVDAFLSGAVAFTDIAAVVHDALDCHVPDGQQVTLETIHGAAAATRRHVAARVVALNARP
jgi:1-deoxy-D-xylulose-5-phosphate reductoisomerase